jgi:hypothetical protein
MVQIEILDRNLSESNVTKGFENFRLDVGIMIGEKYTKSKWFYVWLPFWAFITPGCLIV